MMLTEHDIHCECLDCHDDRRAEEDTLSAAIGVTVGLGISCMLYIGLALLLY